MAKEQNGGESSTTNGVAEPQADEEEEDEEEAEMVEAEEEPSVERAAEPEKVEEAESTVPVLAPVIDKVEEIVDGVKDLAVGSQPESGYSLSCSTLSHSMSWKSANAPPAFAEKDE